jgi:NADH-quinone oxidoreductase subunit D
MLDRTVRIGVLAKDTALAYGVTGPNLRASGVSWDLRKARPYTGYEQYEFEVPTLEAGDTQARYAVRITEMRESLKIVKQALDKLPTGPVQSNNRKFVPPPRSELGTSMEALIHHFKLWTEVSRAEGVVYSAGESPAGNWACSRRGRRSETAARVLAHTLVRQLVRDPRHHKGPSGGGPDRHPGLDRHRTRRY